MAQVNHPSNVADRIVRLEREVAELRSKVGLSNATISQGTLRLINDAAIDMVDDQGDQIFYIGPDDNGKQIVRFRREGGDLMFFTAGAGQFGRDYWSWVDSFGHGLVADDAATGVGLARPWLPVVLYPQFVPGTADDTAGEVFSYAVVDGADITAETTLWVGRATISHPYITVEGLWGRGSGDAAITYRLYVAGTQVGEWSETALVSGYHGGFDVTAHVQSDWELVELTAVVTSGSGAVACQVRACYLHQS